MRASLRDLVNEGPHTLAMSGDALGLGLRCIPPQNWRIENTFTNFGCQVDSPRNRPARPPVVRSKGAASRPAYHIMSFMAPEASLRRRNLHI